MKILNDIEHNFQIELKRNRMQIGAKVLKISHVNGVEKTKL